MKPIKFTLWGLLLVLTTLWLLADTFVPQPFTYFSLRGAMVQYSGLIAIGAMSAALLLAVRPQWLEEHLRGLDKMYRLHKWFGIAALVAAVTHWWWAQGSKWMVDWGWLTRPARKGAPSADLGVIEGWFRTQHELAEHVGEWVFYAAAILMLLALVKRFPYHLFAKTHKWLAALYLVLVWHSLVLVKFAYWAEPVGWLIAVFLAVGAASAVLILFNRTGKPRTVQGRVSALTHDPASATLEVEIELRPGWQGHAAGQFAFVTSHPKEGAHPYTIASAWDAAHRKNQRLTFIVKALGDHTRALPNLLAVDAPVTVEGPYGRFTFAGTQKRQIWIGAGIGITPFIARMQALAEQRTTADNATETTQIDLFHPVDTCPDATREKLETAAAAAGICLHLHLSPRDGFLTAERIRTLVPDWQTASLWFCGPAAFGKALQADFFTHGLSADAFHQELFEMR
jgi:predicted ferric reductase